MHKETAEVMIPALSSAAGSPQAGTEERGSTPTGVTSAVQHAVLIATRRRRRTFDWM